MGVRLRVPKKGNSEAISLATLLTMPAVRIEASSGARDTEAGNRTPGYFTVPCSAALMIVSVSMPSSYTLLTMRLASGGR